MRFVSGGVTHSSCQSAAQLLPLAERDGSAGAPVWLCQALAVVGRRPTANARWSLLPTNTHAHTHRAHLDTGVLETGKEVWGKFLWGLQKCSGAMCQQLDMLWGERRERGGGRELVSQQVFLTSSPTGWD